MTDPIALTVATVSLVAALIALLEARSLHSSLERLEEGLREIRERLGEVEAMASGTASRQALVEKALAHALASVEAEDALEKLARRRRRRYIAFYIVAEEGPPMDPRDVEKAILSQLERLGGQLAVALGRVQLVYYHPDRMAGIIRASHDTKYLVLAAMGLVRRIAGRRALIIPVRTTGTIKRAKKALGLPLRETR